MLESKHGSRHTIALADGLLGQLGGADRASPYPRVHDEQLPSACHITEQYPSNPIEAVHGRLRSRLRPMRGLTPPQLSLPALSQRNTARGSRHRLSEATAASGIALSADPGLGPMTGKSAFPYIVV